MNQRPKRMFVLTIAAALSAGAGVTTGYVLQTPKPPVPAASDKSYERLWQDAVDEAPSYQGKYGPEPTAPVEVPRVRDDEIPMDGLMWTSARDFDVPRPAERRKR